MTEIADKIWNDKKEKYITFWNNCKGKYFEGNKEEMQHNELFLEDDKKIYVLKYVINNEAFFHLNKDPFARERSVQTAM